MKIDTILKKLNPTDKKSGKGHLSSIREFEEIEKGRFVAFVDEGKNSWDLRLDFDSGTDKVKKVTCDCGSRKKILLTQNCNDVLYAIRAKWPDFSL